MSLSGNLKTMDLAELLQWVAIGRKTGVLAFVKDKAKNYIYFRDGLIVSSQSNEPMYLLGQYLLFQGKITESQFKRAFELQQQTRLNLSVILVQQGFVSQEEARKAMISRTEEVIYDLFLWEEGHFYFKADGYSTDDLFLVTIDVNSVIFEGVRRKDEWKRIRAVFPSNSVIVALKAQADVKSVSLTPLQKKLLFHASSGKTIAEMILELHGSDFQVNFELFELYERGLLEVKQVLEEPKKRVEDPSRFFNQGLEYMQNHKFPEAIALFQKVVQSDPQNFRAHEQIELAEKAICQELYRNVLRPNKVPYFLVSNATLSEYNLSHREGYVASRIDGTWDIKSIVLLSPLRELEVLRTLEKLLKNKLIAFK